MDAVWIILDSLSFDATPFDDDGPETMPNIKSLATKHGTIYTEAYSPGPTSPSSHSSFFTGELPSRTGMHEATPYYDEEYPTIVQRLSDTHRTFMISSNPFIFNGLDKGVDMYDDFLQKQYLVFESATDPRDVPKSSTDSKIDLLRKVVFEGGKPLRSFVNGLSLYYKNSKGQSLLPEDSPDDDEKYQYADTTNNRIKEFLSQSSGDSFVIANYMDIHAPLDASSESVKKFSDKPRDELPVGVRGQDVHREVTEGNTELGEDMYDLYKATITDTDRKIYPLVKELVEDDTFVVITADHGNWFRRSRDLERKRIHVPLIIFSPNHEGGRVVDHTVNLRSLPKTTMMALRGDDGGFSGADLLSIKEDQLSITEFIHNSKADGSPVTPTGSMDARYDFALIRGDARVDHIDGEFVERSGKSADLHDLRETGEELVDQNYQTGNEGADVTTEAQDRLRELGYID
ncbi:sulfatase-like hydrolase/transferase [Halapricum salinum]|uniref:Sulfatase N-terminal domain-containing protein n=1 Tax=Halapricum salinum TaxID=1457250 RepID=A0A4D6HDV4_9EURY|nr:sulfatase-like hydrolase/transferase [Halapricum salinum]QCC51731.1 hypothetical protein DV733_11005 [Halapricum salinum]